MLVALWLGQHLVEEPQYLCTVTSCLLTGCDLLSQQVYLLLRSRITVQQHALRQRVGLRLMTQCLMIGTQRHQHTVVVGFRLQDFIIDLQGFLHLSVHHQRLPVHRLVVLVVGELMSQGFHLCDSSLLVALAVVYLTLRHRDALVLTVDLLDLVQHTDGLIVVLHLLIQLEEHLEHILTILVALIDALYHRDGFSVVLLSDVELG